MQKRVCEICVCLWWLSGVFGRVVYLCSTWTGMISFSWPKLLGLDGVDSSWKLSSVVMISRTCFVSSFISCQTLMRHINTQRPVTTSWKHNSLNHRQEELQPAAISAVERSLWLSRGTFWSAPGPPDNRPLQSCSSPAAHILEPASHSHWSPPDSFCKRNSWKYDWFPFNLMVGLTLLTTSNVEPTCQLTLTRVLVDW